MSTQQERFDQATEPKGTTLPELVREFFELLETREESDNGNIFSPTQVCSSRVFHTEKLRKLLPKMKELAS